MSRPAHALIALALLCPPGRLPAAPPPSAPPPAASRPLVTITFQDGSALSGRLLAHANGQYTLQGLLGTTVIPDDHVAALRALPDASAVRRQEARANGPRALLVPRPAPPAAGALPAHRPHPPKPRRTRARRRH